MDDSDRDALEKIGNMPELGAAPEFTWWLRAIAKSERTRRAGDDVAVPHPMFDFWSATEAADNLMAAVQVANGASDKLLDLAQPMLVMVSLQAAVPLTEFDVINSN